MTVTTQQDLIDQQDQLRSLRQFNSFLAGVSGDQSYTGTDGYAVGPTGQFQAYGPNGAAVEGQPIITYAQGQGMTVAPVMLLVLAAGVAWLAFKK
jgi:hypothetical protein